MEAVVFIYVSVFYFGGTLGKIMAGRCTLDIPERAHYSHLSYKQTCILILKHNINKINLHWKKNIP